VVLLDEMGDNESVVSGPESVKGEDTSSVSVYGGPYEPLPSVVLPNLVAFGVHFTSGEFDDGFCELGSLRSRFWPGALGAWSYRC
jgi:hypothetical protein